jgi:hypothetical protein
MKSQLITSFTVLTLALNLLSSGSAQAVVTPPLTRCNIEIDNPHISENLLRTRNLRAVKVNARSKCNKPMQDLVLTVEIYKVGFFNDYQVAKKELSVFGLVYSNRVVKNQKTYAKCENMRDSKYFGIAYASATIQGKSMKTLRVMSERTELLKCGS